MKIAISSTGKSLENEIDARFGRCHYFLIVKIDDKKIINAQAIENTAAEQMGGAGITAAKIVADKKVDAIITVNLGPRAFSVFEQFGIKIYQGQGNIKNAIQKFIKGELTEITNSTGPMRAGFQK